MLIVALVFIFFAYVRPEYKSLAPDGGLCEADSHGLLRRYSVTANPEFHLIGKETERGWEQAEDISTLLPSLKHYEENTGAAHQPLRERLQKASLNTLQRETGLSRHTILRARRGKREQTVAQSRGHPHRCWRVPNLIPTLFNQLPLGMTLKW